MNDGLLVGRGEIGASGRENDVPQRVDLFLEGVESGKRMPRHRIVDARFQEADALFQGAFFQASDRSRRRHQRVAMADDDVRSNVLVSITLRTAHQPINIHQHIEVNCNLIAL